MAVVEKGKSTGSESWLRRINAAKRDLRRQQATWRRNRGLLLGCPDYGPRDANTINLAWAAFETLVGVCYSQNPDGIVRETRPDLDAVAKLLTASCAQDFEIMRARNHARMAIIDVFWAGFGCVMEYQSSDVVNSAYSVEVDGKSYGGTFPSLQNQRYGLRRIHPSSMLRDPVGASPDFCDHEWAALDFYPTRREIAENDMFTMNRDLLRRLPVLSTAPRVETPIGAEMPVRSLPTTETEEDDEYAKICVREIWDRRSKRVYYMPAYSDQIIGDREWPVDLIYNNERLFPWSTLYFNEHPDESWPIAEITNAAPQLEQFSKLFAQIMRDATHKFRKFLVQGGLLQKGHVARLVSGPANSVLNVDTQKIGDPKTFRIDNVVWPVPDVTVKQDQVAIIGMVKNLVHEIFGSGDFASGGFRNTRSATEAAALADFLKVRMTNRTDSIDSFFRELLIRHTLFLQQTASEQRMAQLVGPDGQAIWASYDRTTIQGDFTFHITAGSSQPRNTEVARQESLAFYQQTAPLVQQAGGNLQPLIEWIAPFYRIPQHMVSAIFSGHKQALVALAQAVLGSHLGQKVDPVQFMEMVSTAIKTGLSPGEMQAIAQQVTAASQAPAQPGGLPGTNTSDQTM